MKKGSCGFFQLVTDRISAIKQILSMPSTYKRSALVKDLAPREDVHPSTVYNWIEKFGEMKTKKGTKRHSGLKGKTKFPELKAAARFVKAQIPTLSAKRIAAIIGRPEFKENVKRWTKAA